LHSACGAAPHSAADPKSRSHAFCSGMMAPYRMYLGHARLLALLLNS
jgi:hypothetical protein